MNQESSLLAQASVREVRKERLAWSIKEFSDATGLSVGFVRKQIRSRGIVAVHAGRRLLITDAEIKRYLAEGSFKTSKEGIKHGGEHDTR